ncbi:MAG: PepSY-associated TM helix domain-containing protein [Polyangiaceae bacterium]
MAEADADSEDAGPEPRTHAIAKPTPRKKNRWRPWLRALHRDFGYLLVGLTFVYALSGLAVNHIEDWNPNFVEWEREHRVAEPLPKDDDAAAAQTVLAALAIDAKPTEIYRTDDDELEILLGERTLTVKLSTGKVDDRGREPRLLLRVANWLHLNRGKKAWTYFADGYAVLLLFLATSGVFMIPGRKGLWGRGAILVALGTAIPIAYVALSGGP